MSRLRIATVGLLGVLAFAGSAKPAQAVEIVGKYGFAFGNVQVTLGNIDWNPLLNPPPNLVTRTFGAFDIAASATRTGVFADADFSMDGLGAGGAAPLRPELIQDMSANPLDMNYTPVGASGGIADFFIIAERPTWHFTQTFLVPGTAGTPFSLLESGGNVSATIVLFGTAYDSLTPLLLTNWTAIISAQYTSETIASLLAKLSTTGIENVPWSGNFEATAVPEPATLLTFGLGAAIAAGVARRRRAKK